MKASPAKRAFARCVLTGCDRGRPVSIWGITLRRLHDG